jgi:hypothetical protein
MCSWEGRFMSRVTTILILAVISSLFMSALIAGSASLARSQDDESAQSEDWQPYTPNFAASQPDTKIPPPNVAGCWSGDLDDNRLGAGTGYVFIVQHGTKLTKGTRLGFSFPAGPSRSHGIRGRVNNKGSINFHLEQSACVVNIHGKVVSDDASGTYSVKKACRAGGKLVGTFDFTFDPTGTTCQ